MAVDRQRIYHKRDRLRQLRVFCHAARMESISRAAESLGLSQPAVSLHVRELEHEMEAMLFDRSGPRIALTSAGERLFRLANPMVEAMDRLPDAFTEGLDDLISGEVRMTAGPSGVAFVLPPFLKRFRDEYPGIRLQVRNALVVQGLELLSANEVDFVVGGEGARDEGLSLPSGLLLRTRPHHLSRPSARRTRVGGHPGGRRVSRDRAARRHL